MDLHDYQRKFGKFLCLSKVEFIIRQVLEGCSYLHSNHVMHRDLKPDNILICSTTGMTRVADFGYARTFSNINVSAAYSSRYSWPIQVTFSLIRRLFTSKIITATLILSVRLHHIRPLKCCWGAIVTHPQ